MLYRLWKRKHLSPAKDPTSLGNLLIDAGYVTRCQLDEAVALQKKQDDVLLGQELVQLGLLDQYRLDMLLLRQKYMRNGRDARNAHEMADLAKQHSSDLAGSFAGLVKKLE